MISEAGDAAGLSELVRTFQFTKAGIFQRSLDFSRKLFCPFFFLDKKEPKNQGKTMRLRALSCHKIH
ncbi:MAG: hypothetical protein JNK73_03450 [Bacteroidia bacterium]|nr:hypothetical protein [Bacteroidia bacterium]